jgi:AAA domain
MPDAPILIQSLTLSGFRAYLESTTFDFSSRPSLAVFAPNGKGKSGLVDGFEFLLSDNGTIKRLGLRTTHNQAGVAALAHDLAAEKEKPSEVHISLKQGKTLSEGVRSVSGDRIRPSALDNLLRCQKVDPIIRGYALRHFVENQSPEDRYTEVASWLQLSPLVEVQKNLRLLRQQVKADAEDQTPRAQINALVAKATARVVAAWDDQTVLAHVNDLLIPLDANLKMASLDRSDSAFATVVIRAEAEEKELGMAGLRQLAVAIEAVHVARTDETSRAVEIKGAVSAFEAAVVAKLEAEALEAAERGKAANAVFAAVWNAAEPPFKDGAPVIDNCPICATQLDKTAAGSREGIRDHISQHKSELAAYASAKEKLDNATRVAAAAHNTLMANLRVLRPLIPEVEESSVDATAAYETSIKQWKGGAPPDSTALKKDLGETLQAALAKTMDIQTHQGEHTYVKRSPRSKVCSKSRRRNNYRPALPKS